jgi:5-methyltetrahydrofolate--homocysteine methyltransferase
MSDWKETLGQSLLAGDTDKVLAEVKQLLDGGVSPHAILADSMMPTMEHLGEKFSSGEAFLPELLVAADTMKSAFTLLGPAIAEGGDRGAGTLVIGTVRGDIHDLGKNLVKIMFEGAGFKAIDLGCDVSADAFCDTYQKEDAALICLSSLLTTTMGEMKTVIDRVRAINPDAKVIVGGAPLTQAYADEIGASGYAPDAPSALQVGKQILGM